ncbi:hypothetical protein MN608_02280 [Microdochium nivale]|nr:hypothetical protein MN608_02280 [Microdochium nivale]
MSLLPLTMRRCGGRFESSLSRENWSEKGRTEFVYRDNALASELENTRKVNNRQAHSAVSLGALFWSRSVQSCCLFVQNPWRFANALTRRLSSSLGFKFVQGAKKSQNERNKQHASTRQYFQFDPSTLDRKRGLG